MKSSIRSDRLFVDTWGWLVLADSRDPDHKLVVTEWANRQSPGSLITTDFVLDETFTRLFARSPFAAAQKFSQAIMNSASAGNTVIERITPPRFDAALKLRLRYRDKPRISFTDFSSFVVMQELGVREVLTGDAHFGQIQMGFRCVPDLY